MEPPKWLDEVAVFYDQLSPTDHGIVVSLIDHDWQSKKQFLDYLVDHIEHTQRSSAFLKRWEKERKTTNQIAFLQQDLDVSIRLLEHLK